MSSERCGSPPPLRVVAPGRDADCRSRPDGEGDLGIDGNVPGDEVLVATSPNRVLKDRPRMLDDIGPEAVRKRQEANQKSRSPESLCKTTHALFLLPGKTDSHCQFCKPVTTSPRIVVWYAAVSAPERIRPWLFLFAPFAGFSQSCSLQQRFHKFNKVFWSDLVVNSISIKMQLHVYYAVELS